MAHLVCPRTSSAPRRSGRVFGKISGMIEILFPRRLHRLGYLFRGLAADGLTYFLYSCSTTMNHKVWWASVIGLSVYSLFFIVLPRIRDIGMSAWWLLTVFIPVVNIVFGIILLFRARAMLSHAPTSCFRPQPLRRPVDRCVNLEDHRCRPRPLPARVPKLAVGRRSLDACDE